MLNLVEKFTPEAVEATDEDGVVAIEYVIMAGALVVAARRPVDRVRRRTCHQAGRPSSASIDADPTGGRATSPLRVLLWDSP